MKKYKPGQAVYISLRTRKIESLVISENPDRNNFYFLDWSVAGYDSILNTVSISALRLMERKVDNTSKQTSSV